MEWSELSGNRTFQRFCGHIRHGIFTYSPDVYTAGERGRSDARGVGRVHVHGVVYPGTAKKEAKAR